MLYVQEKVVKLGGIYLEGQVTSVEVQEAGSVYVAQDEKGRYKKSQPVGYENAKVMIDILLEDTKTATTLEQLTEMQRLFKPYGQDKPKLLPIVNEDCAVRGITKVYFKNLTSKKVISESKRIASLELWAPDIAGIKVKKKTTKKKTTKKSTKKSKSKKSKSKSPAKDSRNTSRGKKAARAAVKYKKLISPEFRVTVGDYEVTDGIEVECFSSKESHMDWCRVELSPQLQGVLKFKDMDEASVELGYEDDFDSLIDGYVRCGDTDYWKEIMIKDDMMKLDRVTIKASFVDCEPQDVIRYVLACAGIEDYVLSDEHYGKKDLFVIDRKSGINTIAEVNSSWGIKNPFFFQKKVFYWGTKEEQKEIYVLEEGETILSLNKYGDLWEAETIAIPWIHHSQEVEVQHSKYSGIVTVEKTIVRSDDTGAVHMYIYFAGGEKDV